MSTSQWTGSDESIRFYSMLFGHAPSVVKPDYAKWMIEDPRINFAISLRDCKTGVNHLGLQVESAEELASMRAQLEAADTALIDQANIACCYARSDKHWITDPSGIAWETFRTLGEVPVYGEKQDASTASAGATPAAVQVSSAGCCARRPC